MQEYIQSHMNEPVTLYDLAQSCGLSPWHASRIFKDLLGKTPFEYIRACRISQAALKLRDENVKVIDVALDFVFETHEGFTRAFSRQFGINPAQYKKHTPPVNLFLPHRIMDSYPKLFKEEKVMNNNDAENDRMKTIFVQVVERPARKMILKRGIRATDYFEYCEETGCDIWGILVSIKEALYEPAGLWLPSRMVPPGTSVYAQGVEVPADYKGQVPDGFDMIDLKPCKMMIFQGPPFRNEDFQEAIQGLWRVMKSYDPRIYGFEWADQEAPRFQMEPQGYRGYIEGRPVIEIQRK
ncbi:helix-turn-helix transcriptional regulator [bacterium]|nr:helix-turn-helix transcriptional regulator [bacterium]